MLTLSEKQHLWFKCFFHALTLPISSAVNSAKELFPSVFTLKHSLCTDLWGHETFMFAALWGFSVSFFFPFGGAFFLFALSKGRRWEGPGWLPAEGVSGKGLSNGSASADSRNCCRLLPCQEQPARRVASSERQKQPGLAICCPARAFVCVFFIGNLLVQCNNI